LRGGQVPKETCRASFMWGLLKPHMWRVLKPYVTPTWSFASFTVGRPKWLWIQGPKSYATRPKKKNKNLMLLAPKNKTQNPKILGPKYKVQDKFLNYSIQFLQMEIFYICFKISKVISSS